MSDIPLNALHPAAVDLEPATTPPDIATPPKEQKRPLHIAVGLFLPLWLGVHVWLGWRARVAAQRALANADWQ